MSILSDPNHPTLVYARAAVLAKMNAQELRKYFCDARPFTAAHIIGPFDGMWLDRLSYGELYNKCLKIQKELKGVPSELPKHPFKITESMSVTEPTVTEAQQKQLVDVDQLLNKVIAESDAQKVVEATKLLHSLTTTNTGTGLRFNEGKLRYDLVPAYAQDQYVRVLTAGAKKYAERNWEKGMKWSNVLASLKRHIAAIERGEDRDPETGELHSAHVMCNAAFLTEYYKIYPQGDDRPHHYLSAPRIGLDIDEVCAEFTAAYCEKYNLQIPTSWQFDYQITERFEQIALEHPEFWKELKPALNPSELPFEPVVYITSRPVNSNAQEWLQRHGFPTAPVVYAKGPQDKVTACQEHSVEIFIDDYYDNFVALNKAGILCYLMDQPHNHRYNVGHKRLNSLLDLPFFK